MSLLAERPRAAAAAVARGEDLRHRCLAVRRHAGAARRATRPRAERAHRAPRRARAGMPGRAPLPQRGPLRG